MAIPVSPKYFEQCKTCLRHLGQNCCCDDIRNLDDKINQLQQVIAGNERFFNLILEKTLNKEDVIMSEWLEENLRSERQYTSDLETELIELQVESFLAREQLEMLGIKTDQPLREAIIELAKKGKQP